MRPMATCTGAATLEEHPLGDERGLEVLLAAYDGLVNLN
jgi:hypothetical protein